MNGQHYLTQDTPFDLASMSAISGLYTPISPPEFAAKSMTMAGRMCHESSSVAGHRSFDSLGFHLGWVSTRHAPSRGISAWSRTGLVAVVFVGNRISLSGESSPKENTVFADAYERSGPEALRNLNGTFCGVILDFRDDTVALFNDRYGLGRLYYHQSTDGFYFSTEAKALLTVLPQLRQLDQRSLAEWFSVGCVLQNRSLYRGVAILPPASLWKLHRSGRFETGTYFSPKEWEQQETLSAEAYKDRLSEVFARVGARYLGGQSKIAMSLTGGLDSRAVLAWAKFEPGSLPCYTFGGPYRDCADVIIARRLARVCRHPHTTIRVGDDFFSHFASLAERSVYLSDGTMDVSGAAELHVNKQAREIAPVRLTGNYGSEVLRSHVAFRPGRLDRSLFTPEFRPLLDDAVETYCSEAAGHRLSFIAFKQVPWHHYSRFSIERSQLTPRSPFLDNELVALAYQAPPKLRTNPKPLLELIAQGNPSFTSITTDRALRTRRVPLLSHFANQWQEFTAKAEYAYDYGMPPWLARIDRMTAPLHVEKLFLGRHKFCHFRVWYRDRLRATLRDQALGGGETADPCCYRNGTAKRLVEDHLSGRANRTLELHKLLSVQLIDRLFIRQ